MTVDHRFRDLQELRAGQCHSCADSGHDRATGQTRESSGFCPIDANTMRSTMDSNIFVIGDASIAGDMPKSGFSANSQAKVAAMAVRGDLTGSTRLPGTLRQYLLEPDRDGRCGQGRRRLHCQGRQDRSRLPPLCPRRRNLPICASRTIRKIWAGMRVSRRISSARRQIDSASRASGRCCLLRLAAH